MKTAGWNRGYGLLLAAVLIPGCKLADRLDPSSDGQRLASSEHYARVGLELYRSGRCEEAIVELRQAAELPLSQGDKKVVLASLGVCYENTGQLSKAVEAHEGALALDPKYSRAWGYLGIARRKQGKMAEARRCYDRAVALDPQNDEALSSLGTWLLLDDRPGEAVKALEKAVAIDGSYPTPHANLAVAYAQLGRDDDAERAVARAARLGYPPAKLAALRGKVAAVDANSQQ
jgi:Flp pilus assembly protein TadD